MLAGVDARASRMLVLTEGVVPYLTVDQSRLAGRRPEGAGPRALVDRRLLRPASPGHAAAADGERNAECAVQVRSSRSLARLLRKRMGRRCNEMRYLVDEAQRLRRKMPLPLSAKILLERPPALGVREATPGIRQGSRLRSAPAHASLAQAYEADDGGHERDHHEPQTEPRRRLEAVRLSVLIILHASPRSSFT